MTDPGPSGVPRGSARTAARRALRTVRRPLFAWGLGILAAVTAAAAVAGVVDGAVLSRAVAAAADRPVQLAAVVAAYGAAFVLRAVAWRAVLPDLSLGHALAALHAALAANHLLPLRLGEGIRVVSVTRRTGVSPAAATASTVTLRAADVATLAVLAIASGAGVVADVGAPVLVALLGLAVLVAGLGVWWLRRLRSGGTRLRLPGPTAILATLAAWLLEAALIWAVAAWAGVPLTPAAAVMVTSVTVAGQILAVAPGGFGTYEATGTAALAALGVDPGTGLAIVVVAHAVSTAYSLLAGAVAALVPSPSLLGRLRLRTAPPVPAAPAGDGPVALFLPAKDEAGRVGRVVARIPPRVRGREVLRLVVDDGSVDGTAAEAADAGAEVLAHGRTRGLGAAVRTGLRAAVDRGAVAVAFCDADGEYAPEELERLLAPILDGRADYVVGSRFSGHIRRMHPHRRVGNRVLTWLVRLVTGVPVTDGQSGYRALSARAARRGEIAHDFNYAQVLTLDLLARGFTYAEVPITYAFRESGRSFVRLGRYLAAVVPAVWRLLQRPVPARVAGPARRRPAPGT